jgi:hypothetical protein
MVCPCGCGQWAPLSHDDALASRWQVGVTTCHAGAALEEFRTQHGDDLDPGSVVYVRMLDEGEELEEALVFDPERAEAEYAAHMRRLGLADD